MPVKFVVSRSDVTVEAGYQQPQVGIFQSQAGILPQLVTRLTPHGLRLSDVKLERGNGSLGDLHLFCYLLDYVLTVRIRVDRTEIYCPHLTEENKKRVSAAAVATLACVRDHIGSEYRAYGFSMNIHGLMENQSTKAFLGRLVTPVPAGVGAVAGNGVAYYFAPLSDRIASSLTFDVSAVTADGLFVRTLATWDASFVRLDSLAERAEEFVRQMFGSFDIEIPQ